jgi:plastocyanin
MRWGRKQRSLCMGLLFIALGAVGFAFGGGFGFTVTLGPLGPQPANLAVNWGDTVTFSNTDSVEHGLLFTKRAPSSGVTSTTTPTVTGTTTTTAANIVPAGGTFVGVFDGKKGTYPYKELVTVTTKTGTKQKSLAGAVVVNLVGTVTIKASKRSVVYGRPVDFTGRTTLLGFPVVIQERDPDDEWADARTVTPAADGTFSTRLVPEIGASFRATAAADQLVSPKVKVSVKPLLAIRVSSRRAMAKHRVRVTVAVQPDEDAVNSVELVRSYNPRHPTQVHWKSVSSKKVNDDGVAVFTVRALSGRSLFRAQVSRLGLEPGYSPSTSAIVSVTGVGGTPPSKKKGKRA